MRMELFRNRSTRTKRSAQANQKGYTDVKAVFFYLFKVEKKIIVIKKKRSKRER